ncbi:hypothetical protein JCM3774_005406 [Rhodotorula dairenensis]
MNPALTNLAVSLLSMQVARKIDFEDPNVLLYTRIFYASVVLLQLAVYYFVTLKIKQKNDLKVLKYTEPAKPMSGEGPTQVTTTVKDYDLAEASKAIRGVLMGVLFMGFMHGYMKYTQPLFIQGIMPIKSLYDSKVRSPSRPSAVGMSDEWEANRAGTDKPRPWPRPRAI